MSASLAPSDKSEANALFATAFGLWKSGDFDAAEIGFRRGLEIDPANPTANFYYGDSLVRQGHKNLGKIYLERSSHFGLTTTEGLKAAAELEKLGTTPTTVAEMDDDQLREAFVGNWRCSPAGGADGKLEFTINEESGKLKIRGAYSGFISGCKITGTVVRDKISLDCAGPGTGRLKDDGHLEGTCGGYPWSAAKHTNQ